MLPNRLPESDETPPERNSVDAPLLFVRAVDLAAQADRADEAWVRRMWPALRSIADSFLRGTRHGIKVDAHDGLVSAGEPGVQLTWMDAKVGPRVITPRIGKPVEINALWYDALCRLAAIAKQLGEDPSPWSERADRVRLAFARYWNPHTRCLFDVLDGPDGHDPSVRPNQILAAGLEHTPLDGEALHAVTRRVASDLVVSCGLRTLAPGDARYRGRYEGDVVRRDEAYHNGTAWPWMVPFFLRAWRRIDGDPRSIEAIRAALVAHLTEAGIGSVSEILDGDVPHAARGCPAQAWSVAAAIEAFVEPPASPSAEPGERRIAELAR
jgi:4-alpha-glucanotransferase